MGSLLIHELRGELEAIRVCNTTLGGPNILSKIPNKTKALAQ